ncbi:hypothetical protein NKR19_g8079, partial [Coniochaeta hoffmannii]
RMVRKGVERLGEGGRTAVEGLERKKGDWGGEGGYQIDEILGINAVRVEIEEGVEAMGLWVEFSRINHDCQPNAMYRFSPKTLALEVFPYRTIQPGEEITVSYTPISMPRHERRAHLRQVWGFDCACALCRSTASRDDDDNDDDDDDDDNDDDDDDDDNDDDAATRTTSDSDHRRERVGELRQSVMKAASEQYFENALVMAREWLEVGEEAGVPPPMGEWYDVVARLSFEVGDLEAAKRYAMLAVDAWRRFGGVDSTDLDVARVYMMELGRLARGTRLETRGVRNMFGDA